MFNILITYSIIINTISFILMKIDKLKSIKSKWRISEKTFIIFTFLFGGIGIILGKNVFHHKTKKSKFNIVIPFITIIQIVLFLIINNYY